jgi:hypothetical protein
MKDVVDVTFGLAPKPATQFSMSVYGCKVLTGHSPDLSLWYAIFGAITLGCVP